jgi:DNA repair protein RadC
MTNVQLIQVGLIRDQTEQPLSCPPITRPEDVLPLLADISSSDRENFVAVHLDARNNPLSIEVVSVGSLSAAIVHPREVLKGAILSNSAAVLLVHNHPSGDPSPSRDDIELTRRLVKAGQIVGIEVLDHIIVSPGDPSKKAPPFRSLKEAGLM